MTVASLDLAEPAQAPAPCVVRVLFFGRVGDTCGRAIEVSVPVQGCSLTELRTRIGAQVDGSLEALEAPGLRVAIDQVMTAGAAWVSPGREVAFLSVFSGG